MSVLPRNLKYGDKLESGLARQYNAHVQADSKANYSYGETTVINIPTRPNTFLDGANSFLYFEPNLKTNATGGNSYLIMDNCGAHGFISRLRVLHGSNVLEDIQEYPLIAKHIISWHYSSDYKTGAGWTLGIQNGN